MASKATTIKGKDTGSFRGKAVTVGVLLSCFVLAMVIRCAFYYGPAVAPAETYGPYHYVVSGNDPDYHKRTVDYALETGHALTWDNLMNYPNGGPNPNPPAFAWSSVMFGYLISPFYGLDLQEAVWMFFQVSPAFWAALTVIPVYLFTRDMFGKKPGYFAAFFISVMAGNVERTPLGFSDHDSYVVFFATLGFFFLMRSLKNLDNKTWVRSWSNARSISAGVSDFFAEQKVSLLYAAMAGVSITAVMLGWKGVTYIYAILFMYFFVHAWIKRFRKEDPFGITIISLLTIGSSLLLSFPYYYSMNFIHWYETPFFVFVAMAILATIIVVTRDTPYIIVLGSLGVFAGLGVWAISLFPSLWNILLGFSGYFIRTKLYETIAEAQPPDFSRMVYSYGEWLFYFALIALIYSAYRLPKERWRNDYIFTIMWSGMSIFMAMSAVRFMYNATPVFAILGGWVTWVLIDLLDYRKMVKTLRSLWGGEKWHAVKSSVKIRHVAGAIFIGWMVIGSTVWYGLDAGIPYETKKEFDKNIYYTLPGPLRPANYDVQGSGVWWFGSFGTAFPSDYWTDGMYWLRTQDSAVPAEDRPAFVAWWDYGHWCMRMGDHPSIADNFQQGVEISGNVITAQNESSVIAYYISRIAEGSVNEKSAMDIVEKYIGKAALKDFIEIELGTNTAKWRSEVLARPLIYGERTADMNDLNTKWVALRGLLCSRLSQSQLVELYDELTSSTGHEIRYFAADSRMFPFQATNTGIYYAPVKLTDQVIDSFLKVMAVGNDGQEYDPAKIPIEKRQDQEFRIVDYKLYYRSTFYNSMFYKAYIGYGPQDVGLGPDDGIPAMAGNMRTAQYPPMQGWNMSNFRLDYRTSYWNPYNESAGLANHSEAWKVVPPWTATDNQATGNGVVDFTYRNLYQGVFFLKYYHGAFVNGTVKTSDGRPVQNARVTVFDDLQLALSGYPGVPHGYTYTDKNGHYSILAPYGNVTVTLTNGGIASADNLLSLTEKNDLGSARFYVSDDQAMRKEIDLNTDGIMDYNIKQDFTVKTASAGGRAFFDNDGDGQFTENTDTPLDGTVTAANATLGLSFDVSIGNGGRYDFYNITPCEYTINVTRGGITTGSGTISPAQAANEAKDIIFRNIGANGTVLFENGTAASGISVGVFSKEGILHATNSSTTNGSYAVERLLPGQYNVTIITPGYQILKTYTEINQTDNATLNITAIPLMHGSGKLTMPGNGSAAGAVVAFQCQDNVSRDITVTAGPDGKFSADVSGGNYTVYARLVRGADVYVSLSSYNPSGSAGLDISLVKAVKFNGTVYRDLNGNGSFDPVDPGVIPSTLPSPGGPGDGQVIPPPSQTEFQPGSMVELEGTFGRIILPANAGGYFEAYLPAGKYTVRGAKIANETESFVNTTILDINSTLTYNVSLQKGVEVFGRVFWDQNKDEVADDNEAVDGARIVFRERKNPTRTIAVTTASNGIFALSLARITDYEVSLTARGFATGSDDVSTGVEQIDRNFRMDPAKTNVSLSLTLDGKPAPAGMVAAVTSRLPWVSAQNATTDANGKAEFQLLPGAYTVNVNTNITLPARGTTGCLLDREFTVALGDSHIALNDSLALRVYLSGVVYSDDNSDGVAQRAEYRNSLVKIIAEPEMLDPNAGVAGIPFVAAVKYQNTVEGRFEFALAIGNYTVWTLLSQPSPNGPDLVALEHVQVTATSVHNVAMKPGSRLRGQVFVDFNNNKVWDSGENRNGVNVTLMQGASPLITVATDPAGWYDIVLPQGASYDIHVNNPTDETAGEALTVPIRYLANSQVTLPAQTAFEHNFSILRQISVVGTVTYDRNSDKLQGAGEGIAGVTVLFTGPSGVKSSVETNATGAFSTYLEEKAYNITLNAPGYNSTVNGSESAVVTLLKREFFLRPTALNTTISLQARLAGSDTVPSLPGGTDVVLQALNALGVNVTARGDVSGRARVELKPGLYSVLVYATGRDGKKLSYFGPLEVRPSGAVAQYTVDLSPSVRVWGSATYNDLQGRMTSPAWVNLSFTAPLSFEGNNYSGTVEFPAQGARYEVQVPPGNYTAAARYVRPDQGFNMTYERSDILNISANDTNRNWDVPLVKVEDHSLGLKWDETQKVTVAANGTANYTLVLSNRGDTRTTVNLEISKPGAWSVDLSLTKVTLGIGENITIGVGIKASEKANAGDNVISINASASEAPEKFSNISTMMVNIIQYYGVNAQGATDPPVQSGKGVTYSVKLTNSGNGQDTFNLTVSGPYGWSLVMSDWNPLLAGGESRVVKLTAEPFAGARIEKGLTAKVTATSKNELTTPSETTVNLTFAKLAVGPVKAKGTGVSEPTSNWLPGFEPLLLLGAVGAVAVAFRRRWDK